MTARISTGLAPLALCLAAWAFVGVIAPRTAEARDVIDLGISAPLGSFVSQNGEPRVQAPALPWREPDEIVSKDRIFEKLFFVMIAVLVFIVLIRITGKRASGSSREDVSRPATIRRRNAGSIAQPKGKDPFLGLPWGASVSEVKALGKHLRRVRGQKGCDDKEYWLPSVEVVPCSSLALQVVDLVDVVDLIVDDHRSVGVATPLCVFRGGRLAIVGLRVGDPPKGVSKRSVMDDFDGRFEKASDPTNPLQAYWKVDESLGHGQIFVYVAGQDSFMELEWELVICVSRDRY